MIIATNRGETIVGNKVDRPLSHTNVLIKLQLSRNTEILSLVNTHVQDGQHHY